MSNWFIRWCQDSKIWFDADKTRAIMLAVLAFVVGALVAGALVL